jgi:hypothetical protein
MLEPQIPHPPIHQEPACAADSEHELHDRSSVNPGQPGDAAKAVALNKQMKDAELHFARQDAHRTSAFG